MSKKGFTLIELMVVIAIIGVLSSVLAPQIFKQINKGRQSAVISFYNNLKTATSSYYADTETWPADTNSLTATSSTTTGWAGPYIDRWPGAGPWAGSLYTWCAGSGTTCSTSYGATTSSRVLTLSGGSTITNTDILEIDKKIDGSVSNLEGVVRYSSGATNALTILISAN